MLEHIARLVVRREERLDFVAHRGVVRAFVGEKSRALRGWAGSRLPKELLDAQPAVSVEDLFAHRCSWPGPVVNARNNHPLAIANSRLRVGRGRRRPAPGSSPDEP